MIDVRTTTWALSTFTTVSFLLCVLYGMLVPDSLHMRAFLETVLPAFRWITVGSFFWGLLSTWLESNAPTVWSPTFLGLLALVAVLGTAVATSIWYRLVQSDEVGRLSLYLFLIPVLGLALAFVLFRERLGRIETLGIVLALAGIGWAIRDSLRHPAPGERVHS